MIVATLLDVSYPGGYDIRMKSARHQSHPAVLKRLRRAAGHLQKVIVMIEEGRPCLDLAQQLHAVESAIREAKKTLVHDHLDHCLDAAMGPTSRQARAPIDEFKAITKYL
jgi:DNA-binding FrmR family transcriptional regulator